MRILHWYPNFLGGGGVAGALIGLANAQARTGTAVAIATVEPEREPLYGSMLSQLAPGIELIRWRPPWRLRWNNLVWHALPATARRSLHAWKPDVVHLHGEFNPDNLRVPGLFHCRLVLSPHGAFHPVVLQRSQTLAKRLYLRLASRLLYQRALIHLLDPAAGESIRGILPRAEIYVAPNGPSLALEPYQHSFVSPQSRASGPVRILFVGRLQVQTKGLDLALAALAEVRRRLPDRDCRFTAAGPDWNGGRAALETQAKQLGVAAAVEFVGTKLGHDLAVLYQHSDLYIQCSRHEGQPLAATDALLFGLPTILTNTIGLSRHPLLRQAPHVFCVEPRVTDIADTITDVVTRLDTITAAARQKLPVLQQLLCWNRIAEIHFAAYSGKLATAV